MKEEETIYLDGKHAMGGVAGDEVGNRGYLSHVKNHSCNKLMIPALPFDG